MEALEDLVHEDAEALVERRFLGDTEDPSELVLERTRPVGVDVRGGQHDALAAPGEERLERGLVAGHHRLGAPAGITLGVEEIVIERRGREDLALLGGDGLEDARVHVTQ